VSKAPPGPGSENPNEPPFGRPGSGGGNTTPTAPPGDTSPPVQVLPETLRGAALQWEEQCFVPQPNLPESEIGNPSDPTSSAVQSATRDWDLIESERFNQMEAAIGSVVAACLRTSLAFLEADQSGSGGISSAAGPTLV
jgi:hypothetical protein